MSNTNALAYSIPDAAARIGISRSGPYILIARGEIPIAKVGAWTLLLDADLREYLARRRVVADGGRVTGDGEEDRGLT